MQKVATWLFLAALLSWSQALAQIGTSTLTGRVTDSTGAVVPSVTALVVNTETGFRFTATTNQEGLFRVQSLQPGPYRITFEASGFKRLIRENIALRMGDTLPVDAVLEVGNVVESIEVTAAAQLLETETSATGTAIEGKVLYSLPIYQRSLPATFLFVPGMTARGYANASNLSQFYVAGQRSTAIAYYEDGVMGNDQTTGTSVVWTVQNAVADVKVLTTTLPAEYGHSAGGVLSIVKKTGTNEFHGMVSQYGRTRRMEHRNFFQRVRSSQPQPGAPNGLPVFFMQPDTSVGGPIVLPKIYNGRNRSFFFFGYQKLIIKTSKQYFATTPTPDMKAGDFSFGGLGNPIFDPMTTRQLENGSWVRDPIPNNRIPLSRFDPVARKILEIDPWKPPVAGYGTFNANGPVDNQPYMEYAQVFYEQYSGRIDHQFSPNFKIYGSYSYDHYAPDRRPSNSRVEDFSNQWALGTTTSQNYSIGKTWILGATLINDARIGYYRRRSDRRHPSQDKNYGQILGIPNISDDIMPNLGSGSAYSPESLYGLTITGPNRSIGETISFRNDLTKIHGTHAFKAGYEVLRLRVNSRSEDYPSGSFSFSGMTAGLQSNGAVAPRTGNTFAGFLLGSVAQTQFTQQLAAWLPRKFINSFYFQDDWKVSPTLTLNLGIRYSNEGPYSTKYNQISNFDPNAVDPLTGRSGAIVHPSVALSGRDNNNFQPRFGGAWHPWKKWVFRGGFAVNTVDVKYPVARGQFDEYVAFANQQRPPGDPRPIYQISRGPDPVVFSVRPDGTSAFVGANYGARSVAGWDPNLRNPYVLNGNLSIQYEINPNYLVEVAYQGSAGVGLVERWQANTFPIDYGKDDPALRAAAFRAPQDFRPYPHLGDVLLFSNYGHSTYHSGTVKVDKRFSRGLSFLNFYTFSKALNSQDSDTSGSGVSPIQDRSLEKGRATYDRTHRFVSNVTYELPLGKGKRFINRGGAWDLVLGGFEINWVQTFESGNPLTFSFTNSPYNYYPTFAGSRRPNVVGTPALRDNWRDLGGDRFNSQNINPIIDINYFAYPAAFTPGNAGRNIVTGTPLIFSQFSAKKNIRISERFRVQVRLDYYNALKTFNFEPPTTTVDFLNPRTFAKLTSSPTTAPFGGIPLMNLALQLSW
jgi:hypothetical protein